MKSCILARSLYKTRTQNKRADSSTHHHPRTVNPSSQPQLICKYRPIAVYVCVYRDESSKTRVHGLRASSRCRKVPLC